MSEPIVSIIVITYKKYENFFKVLDSVFRQSYPQIELIIQDDGAPNFGEYEDQINQYIQEHRTDNIVNVVVNHLQENVGTSKNINAGIAIASGKYMKLLTADDSLYSNDVIARCVEYCERENTRILVGQTYVLRRDTEDEDEIKDSIVYRWKARSGKMCVLAPSNHDIQYLRRLDHQKANELIASRCIISTISVFYRMDIFDETQGFLEDYRLVEDMPFWPYLAKRGEKFSFAPIIMVKYKLDGISNGGPLNSMFHEDYCEIMRNIYIANEVRGGIFNASLKRIRLREIEWLKLQKNELRVMDKIKYLDVKIYQFYRNLKYLLVGTKL